MVLRRSRNRSQARSVNRRPVARRGKMGSLIGSVIGAVSGATPSLEVEERVSRDIKAVLWITLAILTYLSLGGGLGPFGEWWEQSTRQLLGIGINFVPAILFIVGVVMLSSKTISFNFTRVFGITLLIVSFLGIVHLSASTAEMLVAAADFGGLFGFVASVFFRAALADLGAQIVLFALFLISVLLTFGISFRDITDYLTGVITGRAPSRADEESLKIHNHAAKKDEPVDFKTSKAALADAVGEKLEKEKVAASPKKKEAGLIINRPAAIQLHEEFKPQKAAVSDAEWVPPAIDLLDDATDSLDVNEAELHKKAEQIKQKLASFGIEVTMYDVNIGPSVMQFTLKPAEGVKLSKIMNLKNDLALALSAKSIRIEAPISGTNLVGIEMPNDKRVTVRMKELLLSKEFATQKSNLRLILGRDVAGKPIVADLAKMPHLLVAGQTGSGKSVAINAFMLSLIYQNAPSELRMILVDPKRVELVPYNNIPHLLTPVINDPDKTVAALKWAVNEMTRRYKACAKEHVRNLGEYNAKVPEDKMPYIVIVIDELADLMMVAGKEVEACICRLAQMARAVGIHLIVATQRPSVDVITGLIKANIPTRMAFRVAQGVDSKTILDSIGAEDLLGQGDMLFVPPGQSEPVRVQGAYVDTKEVNKVTNAIKLTIDNETVQYVDEITDAEKAAEIVIPGLATASSNDDDTGDEATVIRAARVVVESGRASASLLQRRMSLGYARAARIVDLMEEKGFIGPADGAKPRAIYITPEKLSELESGANRADPEAAARENARRILDDMERGRH